MKNIINYNNFVNEEFNLMDPFGRKKNQLEKEKEKYKSEYDDYWKKRREYTAYIENEFLPKVKKCGYDDVQPNYDGGIFDYEYNYGNAKDIINFDELVLNIFLFGNKYTVQIMEQEKKRGTYLFTIEDVRNKTIVSKKSDDIDKIFKYICKNYHGDYESI
jgi:hypothetical protein